MLVSIHLQKVFGRFKFINPVDTGRCCVLCWVDSINCRVWWNTNTTGFVVGRPASLPPLTALATNKVQSTVGTLSSTWNFFRRGHLEVKPLMVSIIGSIAGTLTVQSVDGATLSRLIPFLLLGIAVYFLMSPKVKQTDSAPILGLNAFACTAALAMGFYGGFFGPGMGSIMPFLFL